MRLTFYLIIAYFFMSCSENGSSTEHLPPNTESGKANVWLTMGNQSVLLGKQKPISITNTKPTSLPVITIDSTQVMQEIDHRLLPCLSGRSCQPIY